jgi:tripartite-type tricarboxylate transporter receptor subunit TctC
MNQLTGLELKGYMKYKLMMAALATALGCSGFAAAGLPGFVTQTWYGVLSQRGTPQSVVTTLNNVIVKAVKREDFRSRLAQMGADPIAESPEYFRKMLGEEIERWSKVVKASGIKP